MVLNESKLNYISLSSNQSLNQNILGKKILFFDIELFEIIFG